MIGRGQVDPVTKKKSSECAQDNFQATVGMRTYIGTLEAVDGLEARIPTSRLHAEAPGKMNKSTRRYFDAIQSRLLVPHSKKAFIPKG